MRPTQGSPQTVRPHSLRKSRPSVGQGKAPVSWREDKRTAAQRGYGSKWRKARESFLWRNPLCAYCEREGRIEPATVVDHKIPHKGDKKLFWDRTNWQPLCKRCHDSIKRREETGTDLQPIGLDGWPVDTQGG